MKKEIVWAPKKVALNLIDPTPDNYKIKNALGYERFKASFKTFGNASTVILNPGGKRFTLIDGNTRVAEERKKKKTWVWAMVPNRTLSPGEFKEMSAMFDYAAAGDVDIQRITRDYGNQESFFKKYGLQVPLELLDKMGAKGEKLAAFPDEKKATREPELVDTKIVQLFFNTKQEDEFRKCEEIIMRKLRTTNTPDTVLAAYKFLAKGGKKK